jgi:hypothetical protein
MFNTRWYIDNRTKYDYISRSITTHGRIRRLPHQGARHSTIDHGHPFDGVFFLLHLWVLSLRWLIPSRHLPPLSLACGWPPGTNGSPPANGGASRAFGLKIFRVQGKGGRTDPWSRLGRPAWADWPGPTSARSGRPFAPVGPHVFMHFAPSTCMILTMSSSCPRWRFYVHEVRSFTLQSPGVFLHNTSVLATTGSDFIRLWTRTRLRRCSFELVANPSFMSMFSYINTTLTNACTKMNLLYD